MTKSLKFISAALTLALSVNAGAQSFFSWGFEPQERREEKKVKFAYDAYFDNKFDNREFDSGKEQFTESMTLYGARLTPSVGLKYSQNGNVTHKLMVGIDIMKEFGRHPSPEAKSSESARTLDNARLFREVVMYYGIDANFGEWQVNGVAGVFPRYFLDGEYSRAFFSDSLKFYDNNLEGLLVKARSPRAEIELAFDWNGKYGSYRREQFNVIAFGQYHFTDWLSAGAAFKYHHYANTEEYGSVVDDGLFQPFVKFEAGKCLGLQELSAKLSWYQAIQQDRRSTNGKCNNGGAELALGVRKWNVGIENSLYYGKDLMPFYNYIDDGGYKYGNALYAGAPFYRVHPSASDSWGLYDALEVYYQPHIADFLDLRLSVVAHFPDNFRFAGTQQKLSLIFSLDKLLSPSRRAADSGRRHRPKRQQPPREGFML